MKPTASIGIIALLAGLSLASAVPAAAQSAPERGVFVTQIGDASRANVSQQNADSLARVVQNGNDNQLDLAQTGSAPHRAQIAQNGDDNQILAEQDGDGSTDLVLVQDGTGNTAMVFQRDIAAAEQSSASILQRGNNNGLLLTQNGSDNQANLEQLGDGNSMTATQLDSGNRLAWTQSGDGLADLNIVQQGGAALQVTQGPIGATQFAPPPPGSGG